MRRVRTRDFTVFESKTLKLPIRSFLNINIKGDPESESERGLGGREKPNACQHSL